MADDEISNLSFRDAQKRCKDLGLKSGGKLTELQHRIREHLESKEIAEPVGQEPSTPVFAGALEPAAPATPTAEQRTRAIARQALNMAISTPLPAEYAQKQGAGTETVPGQAKSKSWALPFVFIFMSAIIAALTMYTYRINWQPILDHAKSDIQAGVREYTKQASVLYKGDVETATATYQSTKEALVAAPDTIKAYYDGYVANMTTGAKGVASKEPASRSCQVPPTEGLKFIRGGPTMVLSSETEETLGGFFRFHADCSNTWQRKTSVAYAADFETGEDPEEVSERVMDTIGCNSADHMKDKCLIVNIAKLNTKGSSQGAALQRVLAKQLRAQPSSLLMILNAETLDDSGAAVMLSLMGEFGMLNEPDCDIETRFSAQLLLVERSGDNMWPYDKLEKAWRTKLDNGQETAAALRRRIADLPVRIKAKNAEYGSAKAAAALAAASAKLKADKEKQEAAEKEKAAAAAKKAAEEKAAADAAAEEQLSAAEAAAKAAVERATAKKLAEAAAARAKAEEEAVAAQAASDSHTEL